jgi:hypothetical protein
MDKNESTPSNESEGLREDWLYVQRVDANGKRYDDPEERHDVSLSLNGAVVQKVWRTEREFGCGHDAQRPRGGRCGEEGCFRDSCAECYTRCSSCQVGLCLAHVRYLQNDSGQRVPVCSHCRGVFQRHRFWRGFWAVLLSPFVSFDDSSK